MAAWNWWVYELWAMDEVDNKFNEINEKDIGIFFFYILNWLLFIMIN